MSKHEACHMPGLGYCGGEIKRFTIESPELGGVGRKEIWNKKKSDSP